MTPYPAYKSTNLPWLPKIPEHWEAIKIRELFVERNQKVSDKDFAPLSVSKGGIVPQIATVAKTDNGENRKLVREGDFVINSRSDRKGASGISAYDGSVSLINLVLRPRIACNRRYLHYLLKSIPFVEEYYRNGRGIVADLWTTRYSEMKTISIPFPSSAEQEQIVRYLDSMTTKINKLIRAKKKQIALLQEQRQAIINQAVTKGLDPNVEMKDSGIDWIGTIPKEWRTPHLSFLATKIGSGKTPRGGAEIYQESGIRFIRSQNVYFNSLVTNNLQYISESVDATMPSTRVLKDDVLLNITGASIGRCCVYRSELRANVNQHVCIIRCRKDLILPDYLASVLFSRVGQEAISHCQNEGNRESLTFPQIGAFFIPLPSLEEQQQILDFIAGRVKPIEDVIGNINKEIDTLNEYRNSLISSVVTGQTDVRNIPVDDVIPDDLIPEDDPTSEIEEDHPTEESEE